jgi:hypothetical protein
LASKGFHPLLVISAGNDGVDAFFGGTNLAELDFPDQVITVGASNAANGRSTEVPGFQGKSNFGSHVDIYAPGENVGALDGSHANSLIREPGTSVAAPLVAGVAGLMFDFDSTLSPGQVKQLMLDAAIRRNQLVDGNAFLLDAYEALKNVARRTGGPICGNHVFLDSTSHLIVERRTSPTSFVDDPIWDLSAAGPPGDATIDNIWHDGHVLNVTGGTMKFANHQWSLQPLDTTLSLGHVLSYANQSTPSHDDDSSLTSTQGPNPNPTFQLSVISNATGLSRPMGGPIAGWLTGAAYPKNGPEVIVSVEPTNSSAIPQSIVAVNVQTGVTRPLATRPGGSISDFLYTSEAGDEFTLQYTGPFPTFATCFTEYHSTVDGSLIRQFQTSNIGACGPRDVVYVSALNRKPRKRLMPVAVPKRTLKLPR